MSQTFRETDLLPPDGPVNEVAEYDEEFDRVEFDFHFDLTRRGFVGVLGAGLVIAVAAKDLLAQRPGGGRRGGGGFGRGPRNLDARLHLGADGKILVLTGKVECGQGARAELTQCAAEELCVPAASVQLTMADTGLTPDDGGTFGSQSTPSTVPSIRRACAAARELLLAAAAKQWGVEATTLSVRDGKVSEAAGDRTFSYADLAKSEDAAKALSGAIPADVVLRKVPQWQVLGANLARPNGRDIVTGAHHYPSDVVRDGMLVGKILRPASYGAKLDAIDVGPAEAITGVTVVRDGQFVGVVAPNTHAAQAAIDALAETAKWQAAPHPASSELEAYLRKHTRGDAPKNPNAAVLDGATHALKATYNVAYVQHCPMETRAAVAEWDGGKLTVWTSTQNPFGVRGELVRAFNLADDRVRVIVPDFGGGFGGKHSGECAVETARLAKAVGKPVRLQWTRAEEFTWAQFRPAAVIDVEASLDERGQITSWYMVNINSGGSSLDTPYRVEKKTTRSVNCEAPLRHGSYRALAATANTFGREVAMDELAALAGRDALEFRLAHLPAGRVRDVLAAAAAKFDWEKRAKDKRADVGIGLACGTEKNSFVAACAEVAVDRTSGKITIRHVAQAYDCGKVLNPAGLRAQVEGAIVMGLGPALREEMRFAEGKMQNAAFARYQVPRFDDLPSIDIELVDRPDVPSAGAGETPLIAIAPAIANAVFAATGKRLRAMPLRLKGGEKEA